MAAVAASASPPAAMAAPSDSPASPSLAAAMALRNAAATTLPPRPVDGSASAVQHTPMSATFPSAAAASPMNPRKHPAPPADVKTPLTPPSAYVDFLRVLSPNPYVNSPLSTGTSTHFSYTSSASSPAWPSSASFFHKSGALRPTVHSARSTDSARSSSSISTATSQASTHALSVAAGQTAASRDTASAPPAANSGKPLSRPSDIAIARANSQPANSADSTEQIRPQTARPLPPPRRPSLMIPPSPSGSITMMSPSQHSAPAMSAHPGTAHPNSAPNPASANPFAATPLSELRSPFPATGGQSPVTIRHVVTRTVTWSRPAPGAAAAAAASSARRPGEPRSAVTTASPLSSVERAPEEAEQEREPERLVGEVPRSKRRKVE